VCSARLSRAGLPPGPAPLTFCSNYRRKTCCGAQQTDAVRATLYHMNIEASSDKCRDAWALLECSVCDPLGGVASKGAAVCAGFCNRLYEACADDFFAMDASSQRMVPCRARDTICSRGSEWVSGGQEMCEMAGFRAVESREKEWCFDGKTPVAYDSDARGKRGSGGAAAEGEGLLARLSAFVKARGWVLVPVGLLIAGAGYVRWKAHQQKMFKMRMLARARAQAERKLALNQARRQQQADLDAARAGVR